MFVLVGSADGAQRSHHGRIRALGVGRIFPVLVKTATHHLAPTGQATFDPHERFLISQTFFARIPTFPTRREAIVADDPTTTTGIAALRHDGVLKL